MTDYNVAIPVKLDAFVFNKDACSGGQDDAKIAPITQPNYTFLRIKEFVLQNDVLEHVDIHNAIPPAMNSRLTNLGTGAMRDNRLGVYLHWSTPRPYRSGATAKPKDNSNLKANRFHGAGKDAPAAAPTVRNPPTRWLVIRVIDPDASTTLPSTTKFPAVEAWVVESSRMWNIDELGMDVDLQTDVSPYLFATSDQARNPEDISTSTQAEIFIGEKSKVDDYDKTKKKNEIDLNLLNTSNMLFPDYQPHNGNVFSILDNFKFQTKEMKTPVQITDAVANYFVLGWHGDANQDPFWVDKTKRSELLSDLSMKVKNQDTLQDWLNNENPARAICHGAMFNVEWHMDWSDDSKKPKKRPGNDFTKSLSDKMSIGLGTTPIDSLLAYIEAHQPPPNDTNANTSDIASNIYALRKLLRAQTDSVTGQQAAADQLQSYNFTRLAGGTHYSLPEDPANKGKKPDDSVQDALRSLNESQRLLDTIARTYQRKQWDTFSMWWKYVTNVDNKKGNDNKAERDAARVLRDARTALTTFMAQDPPGYLQQQINALISTLTGKGMTPKAGTFSEFVQQRDPSLFVAGAKSGWPVDFISKLLVRPDPQLVKVRRSTDQAATKLNITPSDDSTYGISCLPEKLQSTARTLIQEFLDNNPNNSNPSNDPPAVTYVPPLYHDQGDPESNDKPPADAPWRDRWESTQPWFPLFVEWEAEYFHIEMKDAKTKNDIWKFGPMANRGPDATRYMYGISDKVVLSSLGDPKSWDRRTISGRILLLPQPTFSLKAQIEQLFSSTPKPILDNALSEDKRTELLKNIADYPFLSAPLDGFTNHLLTTAQGGHLKPLLKAGTSGDDATLVALKEAYQLPNFYLNQQDIEAIGIESDLTPYGTLVQVQAESSEAFKPVTHGQFRFTKLNIIDKFGQCADAINQKPTINGRPPIYPCISDYFQPQVARIESDPNRHPPNTVVEPPHDDLCEFMQIQPQINQPARLNFSFVKRRAVTTGTSAADDQPASIWQPIADWEDNPIWGWLVVNYVDNGVQFFLPNGKFYREVRVLPRDAPVPATNEPKWLPFRETTTTGPEAVQLDELLKKFTGDGGNDYLDSFIKMATKATESTTISPSAYGQFTNALVGKPLAMINAAVSLELADPPRTNQSALQPNNKASVLDYSFPFKLGDVDRLYDGLVGYFRAVDPTPPPPPPGATTGTTTAAAAAPAIPDAGKELLLSTLYTDHTDAKGSFQPTTASLQTLTPYFEDPTTYTVPVSPGTASSIVTQFSLAHNGKFNPNVFGCIIDPFIPLHVFSSILPVQPLQLPSWTWETSLKNMASFFHFGPLVVPANVPAFTKEKELGDGYDLGTEEGLVVDGVILPPGLKREEWAWLQGYDVPSTTSTSATTTAGEQGGQGDAPVEMVTKFMALGLKANDAKPKFERGPYTALEGYLQMRAPVQQGPVGEGDDVVI